jgi:NAD(P)-dependent dehydrogenase (short-subunit alcohol dehydrogenase family)
MGQVDGKVAVVTGGASGIGAACAATLAREGAKVVVTDLDDTGGRDLVDKISDAGGEAIFLHQDVSLEESWPGVIEATERRFGRLNVMVANAGIGILECAVESDGIRVNTVHPGVIDTPIWRSYQGPAGATCRLIRTRSPKPGCRLAGLGEHKISLTGCSSSPPTRPAT